MPRGVTEFYYTREIPSRSVAIAKVTTAPHTPAQLVDIHNLSYLPATLGVWKATSDVALAPDFVAPDLNVATKITGASSYYLDNHIFELTGTVGTSGKPLFYYHHLPADGIIDVRILDLDGAMVETEYKLVGNSLYHNLDGAAYRIRFVDISGYVHTTLLEYRPAMHPGLYSPSDDTYIYVGRSLTVHTAGDLWIRFLEPGGYRLLPPYDTMPNAPWFPRVRFAQSPPAPEYYRQPFEPMLPYMSGFWVKGEVVDPHIVGFERKNMYLVGQYLPDVLVFDRENAIKHALDGTPAGSPSRRGGFYPWKRGLVKYDDDRPAIDPGMARMELGVELEADDIVFAFYAYAERDLLYRAIDLNPFTNPVVKNRVVRFYQREDEFTQPLGDPSHTIFFSVLDEEQGDFFTNDPYPVNKDWESNDIHVFADAVVGANVGPNQFVIEDARTPGGGLAPQFQDIPEAANFWDLGYWDGKPYPIGGALVLHLPASILDRMTRADVEQKIKADLPAGVEPVIFYYQNDGEEFR